MKRTGLISSSIAVIVGAALASSGPVSAQKDAPAAPKYRREGGAKLNVSVKQTELTRGLQEKKKGKAEFVPEVSAEEFINIQGQQKAIRGQEIAEYRRLIEETEKDDPELPDLLFRLAEKYAQMQRYWRFRQGELYAKIDRAKGSAKAQLVSKQKTYNAEEQKYLTQAIDGSLKRMQLDFIDLVYCHRSDPNTPLEETVSAMSDMITRGKALYWGTSEWAAADIRAAWDIADKHHLHKPVMEQPQYNLFHTKRVEQEYASLYADIGLGLTTWSPLASGLLTGKYRHGIPAGSRGALESMSWLAERLTDEAKNAAVDKLEGIAAEIGASVGQMAIAWALKNPHVSTVITGASNVGQLRTNLLSVDVVPRLTPEVVARIDEISAPLAT